MRSQCGRSQVCDSLLLRPSTDTFGEPMTRCARLVKKAGVFHASLRAPSLPSQYFGSDLLAMRRNSDSMLVSTSWGQAGCLQGRLDARCYKRVRCPIAKPVVPVKPRERSPGTCSSPLPMHSAHSLLQLLPPEFFVQCPASCHESCWSYQPNDLDLTSPSGLQFRAADFKHNSILHIQFGSLPRGSPTL